MVSLYHFRKKENDLFMHNMSAGKVFGPDGEMVQDPVASKGLLDLMKVNSLAIRSNSSINNFLCETMEFFLADAKQKSHSLTFTTSKV